MLDIGDIREDIDAPQRKELLCSMYGERSSFPSGLELKQLKTYLNAGETVRIRYSSAPYSLCRFYWLCRRRLPYDKEIYAVKLPEYAVMRPNYIACHQNWASVPAKDFAGFLPHEAILSKPEICMHARRWAALIKNNSPLCAVVNGRLIKVPEDFYDFMIFKCLTAKPVHGSPADRGYHQPLPGEY